MSVTATPPVLRQQRPVGGGRRRLRYPKVAAAIAIVIGVLMTALGGGVATRYLTKSAITWTAALGVCALAIGLALLVYGWTEFWRVSHRWQRLWFIPVVIVSLLTMVSVAQGAMLAYGPRNNLGSASPADSGLAYSNVTFRTSDGVRLAAWFIPSHNGAAVVTLPGSGSNRAATLGQATVLARHGYGVLMVDPRGQGQSRGRAMDAGWYGDRDVTAAVTFLQHQPGVDPSRIGVLGLSMGGEEAVGAAAASKAIRAVVAEGATNRTAADKAGFIPGGVAGAIQRVLDRLTYGTAAVLSSAPQPRTLHSAIARASSTRFLLIAGSQAVDEPQAMAYLRTAAPERVQTWTVPGATHVHGLATSPAEWTAQVISFLDRSLASTG